MSTTGSAITPPPPASTPPAKARHWYRPLNLLLGAIVLGIAAMWVYAFFFASKHNPDQLPDRAWTKRAETRCKAADDALAQLPTARSLRDVKPLSEALRRRADVVEQSNLILRKLVADLRADVPADEVSRKGTSLWLSDWDVHIADRERQIERWRAGEDPQFAEKQTDKGIPTSMRMDAFAKINRMPSCQTPNDIG